MKKQIFTLAFLFITYLVSYGQYTDYTPATSNSLRIANGIDTAYTTGCDMLDYNDDNFKVYTWASTSPNDAAKFAWQVNNGTVTEINLQDTSGITPDVALVYFGNSRDEFYAIVAYREVTNNYPQWEAYQWNGSAFVYYSGSYTQITGSFVTNAIHVDGDKNGLLAITWDESGTINYACGDIERVVTYPLTIDSNYGDLDFGIGKTMTYPDVAIVGFDDKDDMDDVFFSMSQFDGTNHFIDGYRWGFTDLYDVSTHTNNGTVPPITNGRFFHSFGTNARTQINKTSISITERHGFSYKHQPAIAWEEFDGSFWNIYASMSYIVDYLGTVNSEIRDLNWNSINKDVNYGPVIINAKSDDYMICGWNFEHVTTTTVPASIEPLVNKITYDTSLTTPSLSYPSTYYGVAEPALGDSASYPTDTINALALAGKQSTNILYFFYDKSARSFYAKESVPSASPLRLKEEKDLISDQIEFVPNPATTYFIVKAKGYSDSFLTITDLTGRIKFQSPFNEHIELSAFYFNSGVYIINITSSEGTELHGKLIINK